MEVSVKRESTVDPTLTSNRIVKFFNKMKYGKLFTAYKFFYILSLFTSNLFVNVKLLSV